MSELVSLKKQCKEAIELKSSNEDKAFEKLEKILINYNKEYTCNNEFYLYHNDAKNNYKLFREKTEIIFELLYNMFFDQEMIDEVFANVNDRSKLIKTLAIAKSAIRHNMATDLPNITTPTCIVWGENDIVTPPDVGTEFNKLLPDSDLFWIKKCGHAAMMEHPEIFNKIVFDWLNQREL